MLTAFRQKTEQVRVQLGRLFVNLQAIERLVLRRLFAECCPRPRSRSLVPRGRTSVT